MQGVWVFASAAARDAAVTSPQEGNFAYLKDTNVTTYYTGSAWANLDTTGMTNPMTTTGDTIYSSSGSTPARLGIGSTGNVLTVAGGVPTWAAPASGSMTLLTTNTLSSTSTTISITTTGYKSLQIAIFGVNHASAGNNITLQFNSVTSGYFGASVVDYGTATSGTAAGTAIPILFGNGYGTGGENMTNIEIDFYTKTSIRKPIKIQTAYKTDDATRTTGVINGVYSSANTAAISSITIISGAAPTAGTVEIYGIN
jgi:hypothetical protein